MKASLKRLSSSRSGYARFGRVDIRVRYGDEGLLPYSFYAYYRYYLSRGSARRYLSVSHLGQCEGEVVLAGERYQAAIQDYNGNGLYNDHFAVVRRSSRYLYALGDRLVIDLNRDSQLDSHPTGANEVILLGKYVDIGGKWISVSPAPSGRKLQIGPGPSQLAKFRGPEGKSVAWLLSGDKGATGIRFSEGRGIGPAGKYDFYMGGIEQTDSAGNEWHLLCSYRTRPHKAEIDAEGDRETELRWGPPLLTAVRTSKGGSRTTVRKGSSLSLAFKITGCHGESYAATDVSKNGKRVSAPRLKITSSRGKVVLSDSFRFG